MTKSKLIRLVGFSIVVCFLVSCKQNSEELFEKPVSTDSAKELEEESDELQKAEQVIEVQNTEWKSIYLDLLDYSIIESEYGDFLLFDDKMNGLDQILLYDLDDDGIPELFVEGGYESTCIYTIKDDQLVFLDQIIPGTMDIRRDLATGKEKMYVSSLLEGDGGMFYLSTLDMEAGKLVYEILFGNYMSFNEDESEYYLNVKNKGETLDHAFMDFESRQVSKEVYQAAMDEYESSDQVIAQVIPYEIPIYNEESFDIGLELFKDALDDYDMKH